MFILCNTDSHNLVLLCDKKWTESVVEVMLTPLHWQASSEDITQAYRRLSRLYHPDKHLHPERKKEAEALFSKTKKAYEGGWY